jgi:HPt (histidine-containing phosphotransfer) domain-containing protein
MGPKDKELLQKLLATFKVEAEEHVTAISSGLIELEKVSSPEHQMELIERVFREAHSLKGAARAVNLAKVESVCQSLESLFARLKTRAVALSPDLFDQLHQMGDTLGLLLSSESTEIGAVHESCPLRCRGLQIHPIRSFHMRGCQYCTRWQSMFPAHQRFLHSKILGQVAWGTQSRDFPKP